MTSHASLEEWLADFGLSRLEATFRGNGIDLDILTSLTENDLRTLGLSFGDRRRVLAAVSASIAPPPSAVSQSAAAAHSEAERRQLTVLFCDLAGSTALSARLDPEDMREVILAYQEACSTIITRHDGFVAKYMGDGLLAYFGYPQAHEDDAERAVRAGLGVVDAVARLDVNVKLRTRVGIATGLVVVGDLIGEGSSQEQSVVGEAPNLAARLQTLAEPDAVVIAADTRRLVGDIFEYRDLGIVEVKGIATPVSAWQVLRQSVVASRFEALHAASLIPLVGRGEEIEVLLQRWSQAKGGAGQVVLLSGEPGIGKSRIAAVLQARLGDEPHMTLRYFGSPYHSDSPLYPFIAHLEAMTLMGREDSLETKLAKLEAYLCRSEEPPEALATLADLLDLPTASGHPAAAAEPQRRRELTFAMLLRQLEHFSQREPVLMWFEDVHWIDPTSRDLLGRIVEQASRQRLLVVVAARPEFQAPWSTAAHVTVVALSRLGVREVRTLANLVAGGKRLPDEIAVQIVERADGVPLFVEELTKTVLESGLLREQEGRFVFDGALQPLAIPAGLHGSLMARLDRLGPAKQIAQFGAAIGRQFSHELVAAVAGLPEPQLGEALDRLVESELVLRRGSPPRADYFFKHALVQDTAYSTLLRTRRRELHARIAAILETENSIEPEMLAHHFGEAGQAEKAAHHWLEAGRRALRRSGNTEAIARLHKGLDALASLPSSEQVARTELEIQLSLGPTLSATRGWSAPEAERAYRRADVLARKLGADRQRFDAIWGLWMIHNTGNAPHLAHGITQELFQIANRLDDPALRMEAHHSAWASAHTIGDHIATIEHTRRGLALYESEKHGTHAFSYGGHDTAVCGKAIGGVSLWALGYPDQAIRSINAAIAVAESLGHAPSLAHALLFASQCHKYCRDASTVLGITNRLVTLASEHRLMFYHAIGCIIRGWALAHQGQPDEGLAELRRNLEGYDSDKAKAYSMSSRMALAEIYLKAGEDVQALNAVDSAIRAGKLSGAQPWLAAALHIRGSALASLEAQRWPDAERCFLEALQVARAHQTKSLELRAATGLAQLWCIKGRREAASDLLTPIYHWFTEGFDTLDLKDARALLAELS
jgi:class 3 adenylate cyclase/tetratricopeptide (TPR) repeat protein